MKKIDLTTDTWPDYALLDSGDNRKLERYGAVVIVRPETQALWQPARPELWHHAIAEFEWAEGKGKWRATSASESLPESWQLSWRTVRCVIKLTSFKHTGIFPEQAANWEWIAERVRTMALAGAGVDREGGAAPRPSVLNLFGYTGIASIVAAQSGAQVTHVDASRQSNEWAKENAAASAIAAHDIRFLLDDALKFAEREVRRGAKYDGIILDPPAFGRGAKGEVWHIEEHLPRLLHTLAKLLNKKPGSFFLLNGYAAGYSPHSFLQAVESSFDLSRATGEFGELSLEESSDTSRVPSPNILSQGIYVRFAHVAE